MKRWLKIGLIGIGVLLKLVKERTAELEEKNAELERMNDVFTGREFRIKELRDRVKELELKIAN